jgi:hypothetical protein
VSAAWQWGEWRRPPQLLANPPARTAIHRTERALDLSFRIVGGAVDAETHVVEPHGELAIATAPELEGAVGRGD